MKKLILLSAVFLAITCFAQEEEEIQSENEKQIEEEMQYKKGKIIVNENYFQDNSRFQEEDDNDEIRTLFQSNTHGGFGSLNLQYGLLDQRDAIYIGGRGGWIIGHSLSIGFGGCGYFNKTEVDTQEVRNNLAGGHGGMYLEPVIFPRFPVHISLPCFVGAGGISYLTYDNSKPYFEDEGNVIESDSYFIAEPGVELEFNMLKHFRMTIGMYYTYTSDIKLSQLKSTNPFHDFKYGISFKFGQF